ncbi:hypothetical protein V5O48_012725 [Marasmius crinis-equi]|uniref:NACHT-NTPase and P-loop NTPases N-terminal domain-containing protein n=1 Tax=Marasmius crinis-equi TaxID=585013 RepID=A0ABR3F200_9AGAR
MSSARLSATPTRTEVCEQESRWERATDTVLDISQTAFSTVKEIASFTPVPYLGEAAGLALGLVEVVNKMKDSKEGFEELASYAFEVIYAVHCTIQELERDQPAENAIRMHKKVKFLQDTVASIKKYADSKIKESFFRRVLHLHRNSGQIPKYEKRLDRALSLFNVVANIEILENTRRLGLVQHEDQSSIPSEELLSRPDSSSFISEQSPRHSSSRSTSPSPTPSENLPRPSPTPHQPAFNILDKAQGVVLHGGATISINHINGNQINDSSHSSTVTANSNNTFHNNVINTGNRNEAAYYHWQQQQIPHHHWQHYSPYNHWQPQNLYPSS